MSLVVKVGKFGSYSQNAICGYVARLEMVFTSHPHIVNCKCTHQADAVSLWVVKNRSGIAYT